MFEWIADPTAWAGLFALVTLEVVLGVDNLVFIAILSERVKPTQRDKVRVIGLCMALLLRLVLLSVMSWLVNLKTPILSFSSFNFSGRDIIFIIGGIFLLFKATTELHERLEGVPDGHKARQAYSKFWTVVVQIMILDAVFSLDAIVTAVGMVEHLSIMVAAVTIAMGLMLLASKPLTKFINEHPTVVVLCLSFLLMIGLSLIIEGFGFHVPKGYLYVAIGFSVLIEVFNQIATANYRKYQSKRSLRARTAETILRIMGAGNVLAPQESKDTEEDAQELNPKAAMLANQEYSMISGVLSLGERSVRSLMIPRLEIVWLDAQGDLEVIEEKVLRTQHSHYPVCSEKLDNILGVVRAADIIKTIDSKGSLHKLATLNEAMVAPESIDALRLIPLMRKANGHLVVVVDEFGSVEGIITPVDIFGIITGGLDSDTDNNKIEVLFDGSLLVQGSVDLHHIELYFDVEGLFNPDEDYGSVAGLLLDKFEHFPQVGEEVEVKGLYFKVQKVSDRRIEQVFINRKATSKVTPLD